MLLKTIEKHQNVATGSIGENGYLVEKQIQTSP